MGSLNSTYDYFHDLAVLISGADRDVINEVDEEMLQELANHYQELDLHVENLKAKAKKLDWSSESERDAYLDEIDSAKQTLDEHLSNLDTTTSIDKQVVKQLRNATNILKDDAAGVLEDL